MQHELHRHSWTSRVDAGTCPVRAKSVPASPRRKDCGSGRERSRRRQERDARCQQAMAACPPALPGRRTGPSACLKLSAPARIGCGPRRRHPRRLGGPWSRLKVPGVAVHDPSVSHLACLSGQHPLCFLDGRAHAYLNVTEARSELRGPLGAAAANPTQLVAVHHLASDARSVTGR